MTTRDLNRAVAERVMGWQRMTRRIKYALYDTSCFNAETYDLLSEHDKRRLLLRLAQQHKDMRDWVVREARKPR